MAVDDEVLTLNDGMAHILSKFNTAYYWYKGYSQISVTTLVIILCCICPIMLIGLHVGATLIGVEISRWDVIWMR